MLENLCRAAFDRHISQPLAQWLYHHSSLKPNHLTMLAGIFGISTTPLLINHYNNLAILCLLISGLLDILDGQLARLAAQQNPFGSALDIMTDRIVECAVVVGLIFVAPAARATAGIAMLVSIVLCVSSFLVVGIFSHDASAHPHKKSFYYSPGLIERAEAFIFFIAMIIWPQSFVWLAYTFSLLTLVTAWIRMRQFYQQCT
jgi:phosphatidylglycerophosphate synthase